MTQPAKHTFISTWDGTCAHCGEHEFNCFADQEEQVVAPKNTAKHAPGPWKVSKSRDGEITVAGPNGSNLCRLGYAELFDAITPDAALIAAAPAMYAALLLVLDDFGGDYKGPTIDAVRAALAQAEGK